MADIIASDVTYNVHTRKYVPGIGYFNYVTITFGDGVDTAPAAGVPLTKASMGCPNAITGFHFVERDFLGGDGFDLDYDKSANAIIILRYDYDAVADGGAINASTATASVPTATVVEACVVGY